MYMDKANQKCIIKNGRKMYKKGEYVYTKRTLKL